MLNWSEERNPCEECRYTHVVTETPLGKIYIEWKGWKETPVFDSMMPWDEHLFADSLEEAKATVQDAWDRMSKEVYLLTSESYSQYVAQKMAGELD